jgi:hypothetical protein
MKAQWVVCCALAAACSRESSSQVEGPAAAHTTPPAAASATIADAASAVEAREPSAEGGSAAELAQAFAVWTPFSRKDEVPFCVFANYDDWVKAEFVEQAKPKVSLKAGNEVHFGVYAPGCAGVDCIRLATLQCWVDLAGTSITLHTRFSGEENKKNTCVKDCQPTTASCNTPALKPGAYTIKYGAREHTLRIPGVQPACIL